MTNIHTLSQWRGFAVVLLLGCGEPSEAPSSPSPFAAITVPQRAFAGDEVTLDARQSTSANGQIVEYIFDFGDGSAPSRVAEPIVKHAYRLTGQYTIMLSITDISGASDTASTTIEIVVNMPPVAALSTPLSVLTGEAAHLDASASRDQDGVIVSYTFDFGDGTAAETRSTPFTDHVYSSAGVYDAVVTEVDDRGGSATTIAQVVVGFVLFSASNLSNTSGYSQDEHISNEGVDVIDVAWTEDGEDLTFTRSIDQGASFSPGILAVPHEQNLSAEPSQLITTADGSVHMAYTWYDLTFGSAEIGYVSSADGKAFSPPVIVSTVDAVSSFAPVLAHDGERAIYMAWNDMDLATSARAVMFAASFDDGATFTAPTRLADSRLLNVAAGCPAVAHAGLDTVYVSWWQGPSVSSDVFFSRSANGGTTFSVPINISNTAGGAGCSTLLTEGTQDVVALWLQGDEFTRLRRIMIARSNDSGTTWDGARQVTPAGKVVDCMSAAMNDRTIYIAYSVPSLPNYENYLLFSQDQGTTFSPPLPMRLVNHRSGCPKISALPDNHIALVWHGEAPAPDSKPDVFYSSGIVSLQ